MAPAPLSDEAVEAKRLSVLQALNILDTASEDVPDAIARAAGHALQTPTALVSLVDADRQWFKACIGLDATETARDISFCTHTIMQPDEVMIVDDALQDPRFSGTPLVAGDPHIRFYAGAPIVVRGQAIGSLCCIDNKPRHDIGEGQIAMLRELADVIAMEFESRIVRQRARELETDQRLTKARIALALDAADMTLWTWDLRQNCITNFGRGGTDDKIVSASLETFIAALHPADQLAVHRVVEETRAGADSYRVEYRYADSPGTWWLAVGYRLDDEGGAVRIITGIQADISAQKRQGEMLEATAQEMRHRVNNLIGLADALAGRTARETDDLEGFLSLYRSRLQALARAQKMLMSRSGKAKLTDFAEAIVEPFRRRDRSVITLDLPDMEIEGGVTQTMTLVFHELATNAMKYGALRWPFGDVIVTGEVRGELLHINWQERANDDGVSVPLEDYVEIASSQRGRTIVERMVRAQGGTIDFVFTDAGLNVTLNLPLK